MSSKVNTRTAVLSLFAALVVAGCGSRAPASTAAPAATVDTSAIAAQVLAEIEQQIAAPGQTRVPISTTTQAVVSTDLEADLINVYARANPGVVYVINSAGSAGSGFVYSAAAGGGGYIVTNNHVVAGGSRFEIVFADGERVAATVVGKDVDSDLAVLKVQMLPASAVPLTLAAGSVQVGQFVVAVGNPFSEQGSMSFGIVSGLGRSLLSARTSSGSSYSLPEVIQTDAPINPGNSGGPLLNLSGEVVGINAAIDSSTGTISGVGFSIPAGVVSLVVPSLIQDGAYQYAYMGAAFASELTLEQVSSLGLSQTRGAYVIAVTAGSPAEKAGLIPANANTGAGGDLIVAIDGAPIDSFADLNASLVTRANVGQTIELTVLRGGKEVQLPLTLGARP